MRAFAELLFSCLLQTRYRSNDFELAVIYDMYQLRYIRED